MYPEAKFVHIVRDPRKLFPSTMKLWKSLDTVQGLQVGADEQRLRQFVFDALRSMYESFEEDRQGLSSNQLVEVKYEELIRDPVGVVKSVYESLQMPNFQGIESQIQSKMQQEKEYKTNRFDSDAEEEATIMREWHEYAERYGYA
jgi:omega-hydroxy-beta-dihydromenaquinone-9 sulfotransferase